MMHDLGGLIINCFVLPEIPKNVRAVCTPNSDGSYSVFISAALSDGERKKAFQHELSHIKNGDFDVDKTDTADEIEEEAHYFFKAMSY